MTTDNDPWEKIDPPKVSDDVSGKRVDAKIQWSLYWARDFNGNCLLVFGFGKDSTPTQKLPRPKGLELDLTKPDQDSRRMLVLRLLDNQNRDIFYRLCLDIVDATRKADSEVAAVSVFLARTWRWHHLLRGGASDRLSPEEQKGLIGELHVIERYMLDRLTPSDIVAAWLGPLDSPKDFEIGGLAIECKARRGVSKPFARISSEDQLDTSGVSKLLLHVVDLNAASEETHSAFTVTDIARRIFERLRGKDLSAADEFEGLLGSAGFDWSHDYSNNRWTLGASRCFEVSDGFPRIEAQHLPTGVSSVSYSVQLDECTEFRIEESEVEMRLEEVAHGDHA